MDRTITSLEQQKRNQNRVNVYLDGNFAFGISRIVAPWLKEGDRLNVQKIEELLSKDSLEIAYQRALRYIQYKPRTHYEVRKKLLELGFSAEIIEDISAKLKSNHLVDDEAYVESWIHKRTTLKPRSQKMIRYELKRKGVDESVIFGGLEQAPSDHLLAMQLGEKYLKRYTKLDDAEFKKKMFGVFQRKAFSYEVSKDVIEQLIDKRIQEK